MNDVVYAIRISDLEYSGLNPASNATKIIEVYLNEFASKKSCLVTSSIGF